MSKVPGPREPLFDSEREVQPPDTEILRQVERIVKHPVVGASHRLSGFLRFVIQEALAGRSDQLKEHVIGVSIFERDASYNPQEDPIVRIMAGRLRSKLA